MTEEKKEDMRKAAKEAIRNINRSLHEWDKRYTAAHKMYTIGVTEVTSLVNNWICRTLRSVVGPIAMSSLLRNGKPIVNVDKEKNCIKSIYFCTVRHYSTQALREEVQAVFSELDYEALRYDPNDYTLDGTSQKSTTYDPTFVFDLTDLKDFKFS